jgi:hypothetical protein
LFTKLVLLFILAVGSFASVYLIQKTQSLSQNSSNSIEFDSTVFAQGLGGGDQCIETDCSGWCDNSPACGTENCNGCPSGVQGKLTHYCGGRTYSGCNEAHGTFINSNGSGNLGSITEDKWCTTVQLDGWGPAGSDARVAYIADQGVVCVEEPDDGGDTCTRKDNNENVDVNSLDWDCTTPTAPPITPPPVIVTRSCNVSATSYSIDNIDNQTMLVFVTGTSSDIGLEPVRIIIAKQDYTQLLSAPPGTVEHHSVANNRYFYVYHACDTSNNIECNGGLFLSQADLPVGDYVAFCDLPSTPDDPTLKCSGNPNCSFNGGGDNTCSEYWTDCGPDDNFSFDVSSSTCTPQCGQGGCPDSDDMVPPADVGQIFVQPVGGSSYNLTSASTASVNMVSNSNKNMNFYWSTPTTEPQAEYYELFIWNSEWGSNGDAVVSTTDFANGQCTPDNNACKYIINRNRNSAWHFKTHTAVPSTTNTPNMMAVAVRAVNTTCTVVDPNATSYSYPGARNFNLVANVTGNFRQSSGATCSTGAPLFPVNGNITSNFTWADGSTDQIIKPLSSVSSFNFLSVPYTPTAWGTLTLNLEVTNPDPDTHYVVAACSANPLENKLAPSSGHNFWITQYDISNASWWQVINGLAYAGGIMDSTIPDTCGNSTYSGCIDALSIKERTSAHEKSAAPPLTGSGSIETGVGDYSDNTNHSKSTGVNFSAVNSAPEDYDYFATQVDLTDSSKITTIGSSSISSLDISPNRIYSDTTRIYSRQGDLTISSGATISVAANEKKIIFVDGNLTVNTAAFTVPQSSYLGFIVSGDITFTKEIGHTIDDSNLMSDLDPNVTGVFIANQIVIEGETNTAVSDRKFVGEGTFVGWDGVVLERDFEDSGTNRRFNNGSPTELFIYRPAYLETTPTFMKAPGLVWQEVS